MKHPYRTLLVYLGILGFSLLFLLPFLRSVHLFDWDEINHAEVAREMILTENYATVQIDFEPFWEKPPLFFWLQVLAMKIFGINEFAARFPNFICGIVSLIMLYYLGRRIYGERFGLFWVISYGSAVLPFFYFKSGIIDPWFNLFIFLGVAWFIFYFDPASGRRRMLNLILSALFLGLAVLTKGPVAVLIFAICFFVFLGLKRFRIETSASHVALFIVVLALVGGSWFLLQVILGNSPIIKDFLEYQLKLLSTGNASHSGFFGYHFVVVLLGVFPASVIALKSFTKKTENTELQRLFRQWMYIMFWVVILLFSLVRTKILHYSSLTYFPLTFLAAWVWEKWVDRKVEIPTWQVVMILFIGMILAGMSVAFPLIATHPGWLLARDFGFLDPFTREALGARIHWSGTEWLIGLVMLLGIIFSCIQILRRNPSGMLVLNLVTLLFVSTSMYLFTDRIEGYTQRTAIKFYKGLRGQDVYVNTLGFKSYAHLFYFDKQPTDPGTDDSVKNLLENPQQKDAFFVMKVDKREHYLTLYPDLEVLYEKSGFVFTIKRASGLND